MKRVANMKMIGRQSEKSDFMSDDRIERILKEQEQQLFRTFFSSY